MAAGDDRGTGRGVGVGGKEAKGWEGEGHFDSGLWKGLQRALEKRTNSVSREEDGWAEGAGPAVCWLCPGALTTGSSLQVPVILGLSVTWTRDSAPFPCSP